MHSAMKAVAIGIPTLACYWIKKRRLMKTLIAAPKGWFYAIAFGVFALTSSALKAECTVSKAPVTFTVNVPTTLNIPRDTPVGAEVYRSPPVTLTGSPSFTCGIYDYSYSGYQSVGGTAASGPSPLGTSGLAWQLVTQYPIPPYPKGTLYTGTFSIKYASIVLYKIGNIDSATLNPGTLGSFVVGGKPIFYLATSNAITPAVSSCETPSINVPLGKQYSNGFKGVGSTIGETPFNIMLNNCPAGLSSIDYQLDPINKTFDFKKGVFELDPGGATGVGIQITNEAGSPVVLRATHNFLKNVSGGNYSIPLKAAYYKTSNTVTGGAANASMQFTITYQ